MPETFPKAKARIVLVDDHALVREHLSALLHREADLTVCGQAADGPTALSLAATQKPDLVILDVSLKRSNGLDLLKDLLQLQPELRILVLSMHDEPRYADRALKGGALGYISKEEASVDVLSAIRTVLAGQIYLSERMAERLQQKTVAAAASRMLRSSPNDARTDQPPS